MDSRSLPQSHGHFVNSRPEKPAGIGTRPNRRFPAYAFVRGAPHDGGRRMTELIEHRPLTPREREVEALVLQGLTARQIGEALKISSRTVEVHKARILDKRGKANALAIANERTATLIAAAEAVLADRWGVLVDGVRERLQRAVDQAKGG